MLNEMDKHRICPLCGQDNGCTHNEDCWCFKTVIPKGIFELLPEDKKGKACICKSCVEKYKKAYNIED
ncbi:MAG TPA: cysteine-rich CWC family protein [Tissierellaceae bacterium]